MKAHAEKTANHKERADAHEIAVQEVIHLTHGTRIKEKSGQSIVGNRRSKIDHGDVEVSTGETIEVKSCFARHSIKRINDQYEFSTLLGRGTKVKIYDWLFCVGIEEGINGYEFKIFVFKYARVQQMTSQNLHRSISCSVTPFLIEPPYWRIPMANNEVSNRMWMNHWSEEKIMTRFFVRYKGKPAWTTSWTP
jgi:hypothetical protein